MSDDSKELLTTILSRYLGWNRQSYHENSVGTPFKTPVAVRAQRTKFAKIIMHLSDTELLCLSRCLFGELHIREAVDCYSRVPEKGAQLYALEQEIKKRIS